MQWDAVIAAMLLAARYFLVVLLVVLCGVSAVVFRRGPMPDLSRFVRRKNSPIRLGIAR